MTEKFTPGPWEVRTRTCIGGQAPCVVFDHGDVGGEIASLALCPNNEPNARLIAAAPDLLEVCIAAFRLIDSILPDDLAWDFSDVKGALDAAIAKAEGRS